MAPFVRFQSPMPNRRGVRPGIFALVNGLARDGRLTPEQWAHWRADNDWFNAAYLDPVAVDALVYDRELHPGAVAWFKSSADRLLDRLAGHLALLADHGVAVERVESESPGIVVYEDEHQVIVVPCHER